jgi:hypothetical protein
MMSSDKVETVSNKKARVLGHRLNSHNTGTGPTRTIEERRNMPRTEPLT